MVKKGPAFYLATEFLRAFPAQARYGRQATEIHLKKLLEEGHDPPTLFRRILLWARVRDDLRPWELIKEPPQGPIVQTAPTLLLDPKTLPPVDPRVLARVRTILAPYDEEEI